MRKISPHLIHCCDTLCANLSNKADSGEVFDFRELCGAYAMDVVASAAFGIQIDSYNDLKNEFVKNANKLFKFRINAPMLLFMFSPTLYKFLEKFGFSVIEKSTNDFFIDVVGKAAKERLIGSENKQIDFLQIMVTAHLDNEKFEKQTETNAGSGEVKKGLTNDELLAQGFIFFLAGFETIANTLSLFGYNMAIHPDIQERLYSEIIEKLGEEEEPTYDSVKDLEYLEMCFSETLRMYPASPRTDRVAAKDVTIDGLFIPKGMAVIIPIQAIQNDPEHWEEPEVFNPERFAPSMRSKIEPLRFMPFGVGPRNCVGMRLAILELKMAVVKTMRKFKLLFSQEIEVPLTFESMNMRPKNGIKIQIETRKS